MAVESTQLSNEPILILRFLPPSEPLEEIQKIQGVFAEAAPSNPVLYVISDFSQTSISFSDVVVGMGAATKNAPDNIRPFLVGTSEMVRLMGQAAEQEQYGKFNLTVFSSVDEALAHVRSLIAAS